MGKSSDESSGDLEYEFDDNEPEVSEGGGGEEIDDLDLLTGGGEQASAPASDDSSAASAGDAGQSAASREDAASAAAERAIAASDAGAPAGETAAERSFRLRDLARTEGFDGYGDEDDDSVVLREVKGALDQIKHYSSPEFQQTLARVQQFEQFQPQFQQFLQQSQGGQPSAGGGQATVSTAKAEAPPTDPNDPFNAWANMPEYSAEWENACAWNPQLKQFVYRKEVVDEFAKFGVVPDQSIPQKLTAYHKWEAQHGRDVIRNLPNLLKAHTEKAYAEIESRVMEKVGARDSEKDTERKLAMVVEKDLGDYFQVDGEGRVVRDAAGNPLRTDLGRFFQRRSIEYLHEHLDGKDPRTLTPKEKVKIHNYAKRMANADFRDYISQGGGQGNGQGGQQQGQPATKQASPPAQAAAAAPPAAQAKNGNGAAAAPSQYSRRANDDPQRRFLAGALAEARGQSSAPSGGRDASLRRGQQAESSDDDDDPYDFSEIMEGERRVGSRILQESAAANSNGYSRR